MYFIRFEPPSVYSFHLLSRTATAHSTYNLIPPGSKPHALASWSFNFRLTWTRKKQPQTPHALASWSLNFGLTGTRKKQPQTPHALASWSFNFRLTQNVL